MTKLAPECVRTSDPVIRSPARYRWTKALGGRYRLMYKSLPLRIATYTNKSTSCSIEHINRFIVSYDPSTSPEIRKTPIHNLY